MTECPHPALATLRIHSATAMLVEGGEAQGLGEQISHVVVRGYPIDFELTSVDQLANFGRGASRRPRGFAPGRADFSASAMMA